MFVAWCRICFYSTEQNPGGWDSTPRAARSRDACRLPTEGQLLWEGAQFKQHTEWLEGGKKSKQRWIGNSLILSSGKIRAAEIAGTSGCGTGKEAAWEGSGPRPGGERELLFPAWSLWLSCPVLLGIISPLWVIICSPVKQMTCGLDDLWDSFASVSCTFRAISGLDASCYLDFCLAWTGYCDNLFLLSSIRFFLLSINIPIVSTCPVPGGTASGDPRLWVWCDAADYGE